MSEDKTKNLEQFLEILGHLEEPMGMFYTDIQPTDGFAPKPGRLPTVEEEARKEVDFASLAGNFSCVIGKIWLARKKRSIAWFGREHFGCLGGAYFLGFMPEQLEFNVHYVSTGIPGVLEGERYLSSPSVTRQFYTGIAPRPAPKDFCVFKPLSQFGDRETPELVIFFARPEVLSGLHQLATFVTGDFHAVQSPFGSGCANMVTWPLKYLAEGTLKAVLGGWDPSDRPFMKTDELTFSVPLALYQMMLDRWRDSFLTASAWQNSAKKIIRSREAWNET
jgi:uncharacterized protein (DUF169 family)